MEAEGVSDFVEMVQSLLTEEWQTTAEIASRTGERGPRTLAEKKARRALGSLYRFGLAERLEESRGGSAVRHLWRRPQA